ncbi:MAG: hypothetical protein J5554_03430 [Paludibacteraceae bacterium]|nr:hypothetical protein [Paludibacteraceae bacterium]
MAKITLRTIYIAIISSMLISCKAESELFCFYSASDFDRDVSLLIYYTDSSYTYSNSYYREIGRVSIINDSIFLFPDCVISKDTSFFRCWRYDCEASSYGTMENGEVKSDCISKRLYIKEKESIKDKTLDFYFPNDSNAFSFSESYPLEKRKINMSKEEKSSLRFRDYIRKHGM